MSAAKREHEQRPDPMFRSKPCDNTGEQRNKQQTPGTMLAGNNQSSRAGLLSCTDSITYLGHFLPALDSVLFLSFLVFSSNGMAHSSFCP